VIGALLPSPAVASALTSLVLDASAATCLTRQPIRLLVVLSAVAHAVLLNAMTTTVIAPGTHSIFNLMMPHLNAAVSRRSYPDERPSTRDIDEPLPAARGLDHLGTPRHNPGPLYVAHPALNKLRTQPDRTRADDAVVAYLCNFLDENKEKPWKVLKAAGLTPKTDTDWHTPDEVNALYTAAQRHMPQALDPDSEEADDSDA
jgi:hypothetical protein